MICAEPTATLLERCRKGEGTAYRALFGLYRPYADNLARKRMRKYFQEFS